MDSRGTVLVISGIVLIAVLLLTDRFLIKLPNLVMIPIYAIVFLLLLSGMIHLRKR